MNPLTDTEKAEIRRLLESVGSCYVAFHALTLAQWLEVHLARVNEVYYHFHVEYENAWNEALTRYGTEVVETTDSKGNPKLTNRYTVEVAKAKAHMDARDSYMKMKEALALRESIISALQTLRKRVDLEVKS